MVQPEQHIVYAIHEYAIPGSRFLPLKAGDVMHVEEADESGWWLGTNLRGQKGIFPSTYTLPYVFPPPLEDMMRDMRLILLGRCFGVDVASGVPLPLLQCMDAEVCDAQMPSPPPSFSYKQVHKRLLDREAARTRVMKVLSQLMEMCTCVEEERAKIAQGLATQEQQVADRQAAVSEKFAALEASLCALTVRKSACLQDGIVPTSTWYEQFNIVSVSGASSSDSLSYERAWRSTLRDVKEVVRGQEEELTCLSTSCAQQEDAFVRATSSLQERVQSRDGSVARMLAYWADKAQAVKTAYRDAKVMHDATETTLHLEVSQLIHLLEEGRERYIQAKELFRQLRRQAEDISVVLQRKDALDSLSREIAEVDAAIATHEQRQRHEPVALS
ncbi:putative SH3 domain/Variant SH3 domain containing protein [Leishmania utingensis]|uniref:SH3 domain/Variant SH3 domain containing protein n=1 Tax=Leishmania utingensis TaxID=653362 RepID=A0AAW3ATU1_9TRYP